MSDLWDEPDDRTAPICGACGVTALPAEVPGENPVCENPNCVVFDEPLNQ